MTCNEKNSDSPYFRRHISGCYGLCSQSCKKGENIVLVGRSKVPLETNAADLRARCEGDVYSFVFDLAKIDKVEGNWAHLISKVKSIDRVLLAYGILGDQTESQNKVDNLKNELLTNFVSASLWCELAFEHFRQNGSGQITVIGSVAGDRGRQSNYHYGAAKAGLGTFTDGMAHRAAKLKEAKIGVLLVKPGFIDTPMTDHIEKGGPLWASPQKIANIIFRAERRGKHLIYAPWFWRFILLIIRFIPFFVFKRSSL